MSKKSNILFIFSDQQRWDTCGCYGQEIDLTPNLDQMASEGTRFEHAFTCQPVCGPARACVQTGKCATEVNCHKNHKRLPAEETTIAHLLSQSGYDVGYIGKWHLASCGELGGKDDFTMTAVPPEHRGGYKDFWLASDVLEFTSHSYDGHMFDADGNKREFPKGRYRADAQTDWLIEYLQNRDSEKPFFLFTSYIEPHHQNDHCHYEGPNGSKEKYKDFTVPGDLIGTEGDWREEYPDYLGCINSLDTNVGRIRKALKDLGILDDTIVIYTSDHGSHFCTRCTEYKRSCHDSCIRIPMIIDGPGFKGGKVNDAMASLIDLPPTVLRSGGVEIPEYMQGRPLQESEADDWREEVYLQISESQCGRAVRTKKWKYSVRAPEGKAPESSIYVEDYLYDLEDDPHERNNLVAVPELQNVRAELAGKLRKYQQKAHEKAATILSQEAYKKQMNLL